MISSRTVFGMQLLDPECLSVGNVKHPLQLLLV